eukprot:23959_5
MKMLGIAALYLLTRPSAGDTPVHCLLEQMYGEWTIEMGTPTNTVLTALPSCEGVAAVNRGDHAPCRPQHHFVGGPRHPYGPKGHVHDGVRRLGGELRSLGSIS